MDAVRHVAAQPEVKMRLSWEMQKLLLAAVWDTETWFLDPEMGIILHSGDQ